MGPLKAALSAPVTSPSESPPPPVPPPRHPDTSCRARRQLQARQPGPPRVALLPRGPRNPGGPALPRGPAVPACQVGSPLSPWMKGGGGLTLRSCMTSSAAVLGPGSRPWLPRAPTGCGGVGVADHAARCPSSRSAPRRGRRLQQQQHGDKQPQRHGQEHADGRQAGAAPPLPQPGRQPPPAPPCRLGG